MTVGEFVMFALAILSWGTLIGLLAVIVRLGRLPGLGYGAAHRRKPPRLTAPAPRFGPIGETLPQRH